MAIPHGEIRRITTGYANGQFTHTVTRFCAKCDFYVSEWQWQQHKSHADLHDTHGAALALPDVVKPNFLSKAAAGS